MAQFEDDNEENKLDKVIDECLDEFESLTADSDEYRATAENLEVLYRAKKLDSEARLVEEQQANESKKLGKLKSLGIDPNVVITAVTSFVSIGMILLYEGNDVIHSKGLGFVMKPRS